MFTTLRNAWKIPELRKKILFTLGILALYRFGGEAVSPDAGRILFGEHRRFRF